MCARSLSWAGKCFTSQPKAVGILGFWTAPPVAVGCGKRPLLQYTRNSHTCRSDASINQAGLRLHLGSFTSFLPNLFYFSLRHFLMMVSLAAVAAGNGRLCRPFSLEYRHQCRSLSPIPSRGIHRHHFSCSCGCCACICIVFTMNALLALPK